MVDVYIKSFVYGEITGLLIHESTEQIPNGNLAEIFVPPVGAYLTNFVRKGDNVRAERVLFDFGDANDLSKDKAGRLIAIVVEYLSIGA